MNERELRTVEMMEKRGGGFVRSLANAFRCADKINFEKLRIAFLDYWQTYESMANQNCNVATKS